MEPTISVIIPTRNRKEKLQRTIEHLLSESHPKKEIVVIDALSTDGTVEMLRSYGDRIRWISERDKCEYDGRNKGFRLATGDFIHFAGDDNLINPGAFAQVMAFFQKYPDTDILFGFARQYLEDGTGARQFITDRINAEMRFTPRTFIRSTWPTLMSDSVVMRKSVVDKIGTFDIALKAADYEFWARAAKAGLVIRQAPIYVLDYILSPESAVLRFKKRLAFDRLRMAWRHGDVADVLYASLYYVPQQVTTDLMAKYLPAGAVRLLRQTVWSVKARIHGTTSRPGPVRHEVASPRE